jgi:hypothetical protein
VYVGESAHGAGHLILVEGVLRISNHCKFDEGVTGFASEDDDITQGTLELDNEEHVEPHNEGEVQDEARAGDVLDGKVQDGKRPNIFEQLVGNIRPAAHTALLASEADEDQQPTPEEALTGPQAEAWREAIHAEIDGIRDKGTFTILHDASQVPQGEKILNMVLTLKLKTCPVTGEVLRRKARACVQGFAQVLPDHVTTSAPVALPSTIRILLSLASAKGLEVAGLDFTQAYLNADLEVPVYVRPPKGVTNLPQGCILHVTKALYGLAESGKRWHECLCRAMQDMGFTQSFHDACLFFKFDDQNTPIYVSFHVDDGLCVSTREHINEFMRDMQTRFDITQFPDVETYLGVHLRRRGDGAWLITQPVKIQECLQTMGMEDCNPVATPLVPNSTIKEDDDGTALDSNEHQLFRRSLGQLRHVSVTYRMDLSVAINMLSRFAARPTKEHMRHLKHILRYLKGTAQLPLVLGADKDGVNVSAYCDATWNAHPEDNGLNTTGALYRLCGGTIDFVSQKQDCVTSSTAHAEMIALSTTAKGLIHFRALLQELGQPQGPSKVHTDNAACVDIAKSHGTTKKTRHVNVSHFLFQEYQREGFLNVEHVSGDEQWADALTKLLHKDKLIRCRDFMLGVE